VTDGLKSSCAVRRDQFWQGLRRKGERLLNQQCWLWGQDVKNQENLLLEFGFERVRAPEGHTGSSQYTLLLPHNRRVQLWGFGLYFGGDSGIYFNRLEFAPRAAYFNPGWRSADSMRGLPRCEEFALVAELANWIGSYEAWVTQQHGLAYRERCLVGWSKKSTPPGCLSTAWRSLGCEIERFRVLFQKDTQGSQAPGPSPFDPLPAEWRQGPGAGASLRPAIRTTQLQRIK
jgi:hypothetical protein